MMHKKLGRINLLNIEITLNFNSLNDLNKRAILYTFEANFLKDLVNTKNKQALRKFVLNIILWVRQQDEEQSLDF